MYKGGNRGKKKEKWSDGERRVLWECYVRSGRKRSQGYIRKVKEMWDGRDLSVRTDQISQLNAIEFHDVLSASEKREIERVVSEGREGQVEDGQAVGEEDADRERAEETGDGEGGGGDGGDGIVGGEGVVDMELGDAGREMVNGVEVVELGEVVWQEGVGGVREDDAWSRVRIERVDLWKSGGEVRALAGVEKDVLKKMREVELLNCRI